MAAEGQLVCLERVAFSAPKGHYQSSTLSGMAVQSEVRAKMLAVVPEVNNAVDQARRTGSPSAG